MRVVGRERREPYVVAAADAVVIGVVKSRDAHSSSQP
jgi:hypothetical protein